MLNIRKEGKKTLTKFIKGTTGFGQKKKASSSKGKIIVWAEPPFVFLSEEEKRRFFLNRLKPLKSPQLKLLDWSIFCQTGLFECEYQLFDKPMVTTEPAIAGARLLDLNYILVTCRACSTKSYFAESFSSIFFLTLREEPSFVFFSEELKRRLCLKRVKPLLKSPQPKLLDYSILFSLVKPVFSSASIRFSINRWS